jgi:hypothetical protein
MPTVTNSKGKSDVFPLRSFIGMALAIFVAAAFAALILIFLPEWVKANSQTLAILLVAGLIAVTLLLYFGTIIMRATGLQAKNEALGMPEGSIRALIAVSLILMFAIIGVTILFAGMAGDPVDSNGLTSAEIDRLENVQIVSISVVDPAASPGTERFNVTARPELSDAAHDFGLQLLTTVSTLVVAVAGFYFGSRAVSQGAKTAAAAQTAATEARLARAGGGLAGTTATVVKPIEEDELVGAVEEVGEEGDVVDEGVEVLVDEEGEPAVVVDDATAPGTPPDTTKPPKS